MSRIVRPGGPIQRKRNSRNPAVKNHVRIFTLCLVVWLHVVKRENVNRDVIHRSQILRFTFHASI